jgi:hypothetical protein
MLKISRPDVISSEIIQYPVEDRFIKLPIENYMEMTGVTPIAPQIALINAINNPKYRFIVGALSRRTGKTYIANLIAHLCTLIPNTNVLIMSPNYNLSEISFKEQRRLIQKFNVEVERDNAKDRIIELINGSTIRMGSVNQADACVGRSYNLILFDEAALHPDGDDAFQIALRPTLDRPGSKAIFISTPRGKNNWFSRYYDRGYDEEYPEWASIHSDYKENKRMTEKDVAEAKKSMSAAYFAQEYEASFISFEGQIYRFDGSGIFSDYNMLPPDLEFFAGLDVGFRDPTAFCVIGYSRMDESYWIVDEYQRAEANTAKHAAKVRELIDKWNIEAIYIDSAAVQMATDLAYEHDITTTPAIKDVNAGIAKCQVIVEQQKLYVWHEAYRTIEMLDQYSWEEEKDGQNRRERPKHDRYSHMADAMRYAIYTHVTGSGTL